MCYPILLQASSPDFLSFPWGGIIVENRITDFTNDYDIVASRDLSKHVVRRAGSIVSALRGNEGNIAIQRVVLLNITRRGLRK